MNPVPWFLSFISGWPTIQSQVGLWASSHNKPLPEESPNSYRWHGWGTVGFPPRLACNVIFFEKDGTQTDLGRFVG